jgi:small subunit ribosomal protein S14
MLRLLRGEMMGVPVEDRYKGRGKRVCRICGTARGLIRKYGLYICRRCFREIGEKIGFRKY